ncbi:DUF1616 domain-containing protein [Halorussus salinisoli]|uniref:DUF1616 domain-containing protein n=1 Tax=Halorussus salinisoli TaxID=2558242 RepID=UPI0010C1BCF8|nr:DUF1616 domain-containing protein [Halorussus salinisoli]
MTKFELSKLKQSFTRAITWILAGVLVFSILGVGYMAVNPPELAKPLTEFYILGPDGNASNYPTDLTVNESADFIVGIANHEHRNWTYTVVVQLASTKDTKTVVVADGATWEQSMTVTPRTTGRQKVTIHLYKGSTGTQSRDPYRRLRLWINVSRPQSAGANITAI